MTRLAPLISAVKEAQQADPLSNPVTVLCMPGARDDVIIGLTEEGALSNVKILTLRMLLSTQFPNLLKESELSALVVRELQNLPESSPIKQKKLASEPATRAGVVRAVGELIQHPQDLWSHHGPLSLPKEIEGIGVTPRRCVWQPPRWHTSSRIMSATRKGQTQLSPLTRHGL